MAQAMAESVSSWGGYTLSSLWSSSSALPETVPGSPGFVDGSDSDEEALGPPEADPQHWPRFASVWAGSDGSSRDMAARRWRESESMDSALSRPQPSFHFIKAAYPHAFHKRTRDGSVLQLEKGDRFAALVAACDPAGVDAEDVAMHTALLNEYLARVDGRPFPGGRAVRIVDCADMSLWDMSSSGILAFARIIAKLMGPNYPERSSRIFIVNTPSSFAVIFNLLSSLFTRKLLDKVSVFSASQAEEAAAALLQLVEPESLPAVYGGACNCVGGCYRGAPEEQALWRLVEDATPPQTRRAAPA